jgi:hypothetical protein
MRLQKESWSSVSEVTSNYHSHLVPVHLRFFSRQPNKQSLIDLTHTPSPSFINKQTPLSYPVKPYLRHSQLQPSPTQFTMFSTSLVLVLSFASSLLAPQVVARELQQPNHIKPITRPTRDKR